jgi:hypothetical protein
MAKADFVVKLYGDTYSRLTAVKEIMAAESKRRQPPTFDEVINELVTQWNQTSELMRDVRTTP